MSKFLQHLLEGRTGGAVNIRGVRYQLAYACHRLLDAAFGSSSETIIRLEGFEDLDVELAAMTFGGGEYIQLKSSKNRLDAATFWSTGALQNFFKQALLAPTAQFVVVHSMELAKGHMANLARRPLESATAAFWSEKLQADFPESTTEQVQNFLQRISFQKHTVEALEKACIVQLLEHFGVNNGTEQPYLDALFYAAMRWSEARAEVRPADVLLLLTEVKDALSRHPTNPAVANHWIELVSYHVEDVAVPDGLDYYSGLAARPAHIAHRLPVRRRGWEKSVAAALTAASIVVIRASSGQGKSTLAWQAGFTATSEDGYTVYQLRSCATRDEAAAVLDFLRSRLRVGQVPLVIIDGLNSAVQQWARLVEGAADLPVKFIVTTREEDWYRYGADLSRVRVQMVAISMSLDEAEEIHRQLKKKSLVHESVGPWQAAWEKVADKGLLIEYVYLLTQGDMLGDRLSAQLKLLASEPDAKAKLQLLRIIALADVLNIPLATARLARHIEERVGFQTDRGEVFNGLEREYHLRFGGHFVQGLHPVRSAHLVELLHQHVPHSKTLLEIFPLLSEEHFREYFSGLGAHLAEEEKEEFFGAMAASFAGRPLVHILSAMTGLFQYEFAVNGVANRAVFDEAFTYGGIDAFAMDTSPFADLNTLEKFAEILGEEKGSNFIRLAVLKKRLVSINWPTTGAYLFAAKLGAIFAADSFRISSYAGLNNLVRWTGHLGVKWPLLPGLDKFFLKSVLESGVLEEVKELFAYARSEAPSIYAEFVRENKAHIIGWLKKETDTPTMYEDGEDIRMEYLLDNTTAGETNEQSVSRIEAVHAVLPPYACYRIIAVALPYPNEKLLEVVVQNSHKAMTPAALHLSDNAVLNGLWYKTVAAPYRSKSIYEWQKEQYELRDTAVGFATALTRATDARLENNAAKMQNALSALQEHLQTLRAGLAFNRSYPKGANGDEGHKEFHKALSGWRASLRNFADQFLNVFELGANEENSRMKRLAFVNLRATLFKLPAMQAAYDAIADATHPHFPTKELKEKETAVYLRLARTLRFFDHRNRHGDTSLVQVGKRAAEAWAVSVDEARLRELRNILAESADEFGYGFLAPTHITEEELLNYAVIGVKRRDFLDDEDISQMLFSLHQLCKLDIDFYTFVVLDDENGARPTGVRLHKDFFEAAHQNFLGEGPSEYKPSITPILLDADYLAPLGEVSIKQLLGGEQLERVCAVMYRLWRLLEYRTRLNYDNPGEAAWAAEIEAEQTPLLLDDLHATEGKLTAEDYADLEETVQGFLKNAGDDFRDEIAAYLVAWTIAFNSRERNDNARRT